MVFLVLRKASWILGLLPRTAFNEADLRKFGSEHVFLGAMTLFTFTIYISQDVGYSLVRKLKLMGGLGGWYPSQVVELTVKMAGIWTYYEHIILNSGGGTTLYYEMFVVSDCLYKFQQKQLGFSKTTKSLLMKFISPLKHAESWSYKVAPTTWAVPPTTWVVWNLKVERTRRNWFGSAPPCKKNSQIKSLVLECHVLEEFAMIIAAVSTFLEFMEEKHKWLCNMVNRESLPIL